MALTGRVTRISLLMGLILVGLVALAACGSTGDSPEGAESPNTAMAELDPAPDFRFSLYQGQDVLGGDGLSLSGLRGKPLVLNFWAGLCPPCRAEMPDIQEFYHEYGDRVNVFGLDVGPFTGLGSSKTGRALIELLNIAYPAGTTEDGEVVKEYGVLGMPATVFITADGKIFDKWTGLLNKDVLIRITEEMLAASGLTDAQGGENSTGSS